MRADGEELVGVAFDAEVEAPGASYAGLPDVVGFVVLLGPKRRVTEVAQEQCDLFLKARCIAGGAARKSRRNRLVH